MRIYEIYLTFNGEVNPAGIGSPVIFVRTGGCHLRCYKNTKGYLCDTPHSLEASSGQELSIPQIKEFIKAISETTGVRLICLTGGDPLWRKPEELHELFTTLVSEGFIFTVETSGTLMWEQYTVSPYSQSVHFILDYKLPSAGVKGNLLTKEDHIKTLRKTDWIKYVIDLNSEEDIQECVNSIPLIRSINKDVNIAVGPLWDSSNNPEKVLQFLAQAGLLRFGVVVNMQTHKYVVAQQALGEVMFSKAVDNAIQNYQI